MKKVFILIIMSLSVYLISVQTKSQYAMSQDVENLQTTIDSLQQQIAKILTNHEKLYDTQTALTNRIVEMREDYKNSLDNANTYISWVIGLVTLIVAAFGVGVPLWSNHRTNKQSQKVLRKTEHLLTQSNSVRTKVDKIQRKIEASERNARDSQKKSMINRLFTEAVTKEREIKNLKNKYDTTSKREANEARAQAISLYSNIIKIDEKNIPALTNRSLLYAELERFDKVIEDTTRIIEIEPTSPVGYVIRGEAYSRMNSYDQAIRDCTKAIALEPDQAAVYSLRATMNWRVNKWQDSIDDYDKAATIKELSASDYNNRAFSYFKLGKLDVALSDVEISLNKDNASAATYDTRGCIYMAKGCNYYMQALEDFTKAISIDPRLWECYENRANLYKLLHEKETDEAKKAEYIELYKNDLEIFRTKKLPTDKIEETEQTKNGAE